MHMGSTKPISKTTSARWDQARDLEFLSQFKSNYRLLVPRNEITVKIGDSHNKAITLGRASCHLADIFGDRLDGDSKTNLVCKDLKAGFWKIPLISLGDRVSGTILHRFTTGPCPTLSTEQELHLNNLIAKSCGWRVLSPQCNPLSVAPPN